MVASKMLRCWFLSVTVALLAVTVAHSAAPKSKAAAPGFYKVMVGDIEVTALSDGTVELPMDTLLTNITPDQFQKAMSKSYLKAPLETSVNAYLVNTGQKLVLIDTGAGKLFGPTLGNLQASLKAAGYTAEQVDEVYITHMHGDHLGGLIVNDKLAFPNATVRADKHDADFWLSEAELSKAPAEGKGSFQGAMMSINPYVKAGKFKSFEGNTDLVPGVKALSSHGHTPGHTTYVVESKGQKMVFWGDLMHVAAVQFETPSVTIQFDSDSKTAAEQRKLAYADAAKNGYLVGVAHISFPGIGRIRAEGSGYVWLPVNYSTK
jgi:glyoxylase-like metal-dependent hydrolase (beta-lactamase superfamily II)